MVIALGIIVAAFTVLLAIGALTGRVKARSCCAVADPRRDLRMRDAVSGSVASAEVQPNEALARLSE